MHTVYVLIDPRNERVRYVGITEDVYARFYQHLRCLENNVDKNLWIQELKSENVMLIMRTVGLAETFEEAREREDYWIHHYLSQGERLLNVQLPQLFTYEDFVSKVNVIISKPETPRQKSVKTEQRDTKIRQFASTHDMTHAQLAKKFKVSVSTIARALSDGKPSTNGHSKERNTDEMEALVVTEGELVAAMN